MGTRPSSIIDPSPRLDAAVDWLTGAALPFWSEVGVDRIHGGFVERLDLFGRDAVAVKRTRAQCRQIFCFAQAADLGWSSGEAAARHGWRFLHLYHRRDDGAWVRSVTSAGEIVDPTFDLYDTAFVLFAHAAFLRLSRDEEVLDHALETIDRLQALLGQGSGNGWRTSERPSEFCLQNPHMHLFEAALELADVSGHPQLLAFAETLLTLFHERLYDADLGLVREVHGRDWARLDTPAGRLVEPGHQFEWAWLLLRAERRLGLSSGYTARRLFAGASANGVSPVTGLVYDAIDEDGRLIRASSRCWPQTERLKAALAMIEHGLADAYADVAQSLDALLGRYLAVAPFGAWGDQLDAAGRHVADRIPSTTFYHIMVALTEVTRLRPLLAAPRNPASSGVTTAPRSPPA